MRPSNQIEGGSWSLPPHVFFHFISHSLSPAERVDVDSARLRFPPTFIVLAQNYKQKGLQDGAPVPLTTHPKRDIGGLVPVPLSMTSSQYSPAFFLPLRQTWVTGAAESGKVRKNHNPKKKRQGALVYAGITTDPPPPPFPSLSFFYSSHPQSRWVPFDRFFQAPSRRASKHAIPSLV